MAKIFYKENQKDLDLSDTKIYYEGLVINTVWDCCRDRNYIKETEQRDEKQTHTQAFK